MKNNKTTKKPDKVNSALNTVLYTCPDVVYCGKCKFHRNCEGYMSSWEECKHDVKRKHDHERCWKVYDNPKEKNKNNDCKYFELKWWRKLLARI